MTPLAECDFELLEAIRSYWNKRWLQIVKKLKTTPADPQHPEQSSGVWLFVPQQARDMLIIERPAWNEARDAARPVEHKLVFGDSCIVPFHHAVRVQHRSLLLNRFGCRPDEQKTKTNTPALVAGRTWNDRGFNTPRKKRFDGEDNSASDSDNAEIESYDV